MAYCGIKLYKLLGFLSTGHLGKRGNDVSKNRQEEGSEEEEENGHALAKRLMGCLPKNENTILLGGESGPPEKSKPSPLR